MTKLMENLANLTLEEIIGQSASKIKQLAKDLKLIGSKGMELELEIKGMVVTHLAERGLAAGSSKGKMVSNAGGGNIFQQGFGDLKEVLKSMFKEFKEFVVNRAAAEEKTSNEMYSMQKSFSQISGFVEDFNAKLKELGKAAAEGQAKQVQMDRAIKELREAKFKQEGAMKAMEENTRKSKYRKMQSLHGWLCSRLTQQ
jgi:methyl-accepting chemotaxis protein